VSEQFLNVYLKLQATAQLFRHGSTGHWRCDPYDLSKNGDAFVPWPTRHFRLCYAHVYAIKTIRCGDLDILSEICISIIDIQELHQA